MLLSAVLEESGTPGSGSYSSGSSGSRSGFYGSPDQAYVGSFDITGRLGGAAMGLPGVAAGGSPFQLQPLSASLGTPTALRQPLMRSRAGAAMRARGGGAAAGEPVEAGNSSTGVPLGPDEEAAFLQAREQVGDARLRSPTRRNALSKCCCLSNTL